MKHSKRNRLLALALAICLSMSFVLPINAAGLGLSDEDTDVSGVDTYALSMGTKPADGTTAGNPFPKGTGGSNSFRIPAMVTLNNGTIVAAADARWNTTYDGGGLDTIVSRSSDGGQTWSYTFANYLGDNGNQYSGSGSTAFIDPALATDGSTVYMLCDLYPYGVALNGSVGAYPSTAVGFDSNNRLLLSDNNHWSYDYYLDGGTIYTSSGVAVTGYKVDEYFNITGTDGTNTNLFFSDSPFKVVRTGYLYLTTSADGGKTWSAPTLLPNIKTSGEQVCLIGPGRGVVTSSNYLIFPVYSYNNGTQKMGFICRAKDGSTWGRIDCDTISGWSSEAAVVALDDTTLRFFYRNGTANLCYVDYIWTNGGQIDGNWGSPVNTGIATNSNTQISAITYSKTVDGQKVLLVSCPTGPNERGSDQSGASYRLNGKIFVGVVQSDKTVAWKNSISVPSVNSSNQFMYSCLTELDGGDVAILYEDCESKWGAGDNCYYTMSYKTYGTDKLGLTFDGGSTEETETVKDDTTGVTAVLPKGSTMTATKVTDTAAITGLTGDWVAYDISINGGAYTASAAITLPIGELANSEGALYGFVVENGAAVPVDGGSKSADGKYFTFTAPHFSVVGVAVEAAGGTTDYEGNPIQLKVGKTFKTTDKTGNYENYEGNVIPSDGVVEVTLKGEDKSEPTYTEASITVKALADQGGYGYDAWKAIDGYYYYLADDEQYYQVYAYYNSYNYYYYYGYKKSSSTSVQQLGRVYYYSGNTLATGIYTQSGTSQSAYTDITFKGLKPGTATVTVGNVSYVIEVSKKTETVTLQPGGTYETTDWGTTIEQQPDSKFATAKTESGKLTITGVAEGNTTLMTDTTVFTIKVNNGTELDIKEGTTGDISVTLTNGQTVEWSSDDSSYVGVAGRYDAANNTYTGGAILSGYKVTDGSRVTVTATIKDANGNLVGTQKWLVKVIEGDADTNTNSRYIYVNVKNILNCKAYYSINGGELIEITQNGILIDNQITGHFNIMFFAAPETGYALTDMCVTGSNGEYYTLTNGNPDGTGSDAWPFVDPAQTTLPNASSSSDWKKIKNNLHGFRWALLEGNMTIDRMKVLFSNAIAKGCDGVTNFTKNANESYYTEVQFIAQPLPTVKKDITSITKSNGSTVDYTPGMQVTVNDTINYTITITKPARLSGDVYQTGISYIVTSPITDSNKPTYSNDYYGVVTYSNEVLNDPLTGVTNISYPDMGDSTTENVPYTYATSLKLTRDNFSNVVKNGKITNVADFSYSYSSQYSEGTLTASASANAEVTVDTPNRVIDFGLPVEIDLSTVLNGLFGNGTTVVRGTSEAGGTIKGGEGGTFTYTPGKVLNDTDHVTLYLNDGGSYGVNIIPASNVLYEDDFLTQAAADSGTAWTHTDAAAATQQSGDQSTLYGYDGAYKTSTGNSLGSAWTISVPNSQTVSKFLTTSFYGNGFDLIGTAGYNTGYVYMLLSGNGVNKLVIVDTSYVDGNKTILHQVPLVHLEGLKEGTYTVNILGAYRAATAAQSAVSAAAYGLYDDGPAAGDGIYAALDKFYEAGYDIDDVELVYFDQSSALAAMNSAAVYASNASTMAAAESTARPAGNTVTIDGFRVYRDTNNSAYPDSERGLVYVNVLDAVESSDAAYTEFNSEYVFTDRTDYESNGGPQNEIYLTAGKSVVLSTNLPAGTLVQVSARAVTGTPTKMDSVTIASNTEMYYNVTVGKDGTIVIANTGDSMLALGNLKLKPGTTTFAVTARTLSIASTMLRGYAAAPDQSKPAPDPTPVIPQPMPVFTPDRLTVGVKSIGLFRTKVNTVAITTSTDVVRLTVNGKELRPTNSLMVQLGLSRYYTYVLVDTAKKNETRAYEVIAYNADGVSSKARIAKG